MVSAAKEISGKFSRERRNLYRLLLLLVFVLIIAGALAVPFQFETQTLWYKTGTDKTMLRSGQLAGMLALVFLYLQITLALRSKFLEKLFGVASLLRWHRINGVFIAFLALSHVLLVLVPEGLDNLPIGKKYWPEMVGMLLFLVLLPLVVTARFREKLRLGYKRWKTMHQLFGYLVIVLVTIHALYVSESFRNEWLQLLLLGVFGAFVALVVVKHLFHAS